MTTVLVPTNAVANVQSFIGTPIAETEQRLVLVWTVDFTAGGTITAPVDLQSQLAQARIGYVQSLKIDNSFNGAQVDVYFEGSLDHVRCPPNSIGVYQVTVANPPRLSIVCSGGTGPTTFLATNVKLDPTVASTVSVAGSFNFNGSGYLLVADPILDGCVTAGVVQVNMASLAAIITGGALQVNQQAVGGTFTDRSTVAAAAASTQLMAANASRRYIIIAAPQSEGIWINPRGGVAGVSLTGCFFLNAGLIWERSWASDWMWQSAINYFAVTGGDMIAAGEGN